MFPRSQARWRGEGQEPRAQGISEADPRFVLAGLTNTYVTLNACLNFSKAQLLYLQSGDNDFAVWIKGEASHKVPSARLAPSKCQKRIALLCSYYQCTSWRDYAVHRHARVACMLILRCATKGGGRGGLRLRLSDIPLLLSLRKFP